MGFSSYVSFFVAAILVSISQASAQPSKTVQQIPVPPVLTANLPSLLSKAKQDLSRLTNADQTGLLDIEINKADGYDACRRRLLTAQKNNAQWFIDHYSEFQSLSEKIDLSFEQVAAKIALLKEQTIRTNPLEGQKTSDVEISFNMLVDYFKLFNARLKSCSAESKTALLEDMENPQFNKLHIAHSQVVAAMKQLTANLNASLKDPNIIYEIAFEPAPCGYSLLLKVAIKTAGTNFNYQISLLDSATIRLDKLEEKVKWEALTQRDFTTDGRKNDGVLRYKTFLNEEKGSCNFDSILFHPAHVPYVTYSELTALSSYNRKFGKIPFADMEFVAIAPGTIKSVVGDRAITILKKFELQITEVTQGQWYEVKKTNPSFFNDEKYCPESYSDKLKGCPNLPVENVSWPEVQEFIKAMNELKDGYEYRLPTDLEWEYAAWGGLANENFGDLEAMGWSGENSKGQPQLVGTKKMNGFGLYDMLGNVSEFISYQGYNFYRGGDWNSTLSRLRPYEQASGGSGQNILGFRLVRTKK